LSKKNFVYTGCENLEAMKEAKNYNDYLINLVIDHGKLASKKNRKVLDFGAGSGTYTDILLGKGYSADCVEPDQKLQKILKSKNYKVYKDVNELKAKSYDLIYALNVFEHIKEHSDVLAKLRKALRKNGVIIIYVPAFPLLFSSMDRRVEHVRRYKRKLLKELAEENNLIVKKLEYRDPIGFGAALTYRLFGGDSGIISSASVKFYDKYIFPVSRSIEPVFKYSLGKNVLLVGHEDGS
jgi:SAM-dependent methyltransferase